MARLHRNRTHPLVRAALAALIPASLLAAPALAQETEPSAWPQFQGGSAHPGSAEAPAPPYRERWRFSPADGALSGAVIADGLAIAVGTGSVVAIDLVSGEPAWEVPRGGGPLSMPALAMVDGAAVLVYLEGPAQDPDEAEPTSTGSPSPSPEASPSPTGEQTTEADDAVSHLVAIDLADRSERWRLSLGDASRSGVTVDGERAYVADDEGRVTAVDLATGSEVWSTGAIGRVETPPAVVDGRVVVAARDPDEQRSQVLALDAATGERVWAFSPAGGGAAASGIAVANGSVIVGAADRLVRSLSLEDGSLRWDALTVTLFSPVTAPAVAEGSVFMADASGGLYRLDATDGARAWEHQTNQLVVRSSPVVVPGFVLLGLNDGRLAAFDLAQGDLVFQTPASQGLVGAIALSGDVLVAVKGGRDPGLVAFEHDPEGRLVRVVSPTVLDPGRLVGGFAVAALIAGLAILVPFRLLRPRLSPAFVREDTESPELDEESEGNDP